MGTKGAEFMSDHKDVHETQAAKGRECSPGPRGATTAAARAASFGYCRGEASRLHAAGLVCLTLLGCHGGGVSMSKAGAGVLDQAAQLHDSAAVAEAQLHHPAAGGEDLSRAAAETSPKFMEAVAMYATGRYQRSATLLELHLRRHPGHYHGHVLLARALMYSGQSGKAVQILQSLSSSAPSGECSSPGAAAPGPDARRLLAEALLLDGRFAEAEPVLRSALERNSEDPRLLLLLARVYRNAGRTKQAATLYRQALMYQAELGVAARELSQVYAARGAFLAAEEWRRRAAELLPAALQGRAPSVPTASRDVIYSEAQR